MNKHSVLLFLLIGCAILSSVLCQNGYTKQYQGQQQQPNQRNLPNDAIHISDIKSLVFKPRTMTTFRRSRAFPQMKCTGGTAQNSGYEPDQIYCENKGSDGTQIIWECKASMPKQYKLGKTLVVCEGYNRAGDDVVLKGSCGLEYDLDYTHNRGNRNHQDNYENDRNFYYSEEEATGTTSKGTGFGTLLVIFIVLVLVFMCCLDSKRTTRTSTRTFSQPSTNPNYENIYPSAPSMQETYTSSAPRYTTTSQTSSGPGFWTGAATGAAAGYLYGRNSAMSSNNASSNSHYRTSADDSYRNSSSSSSYSRNDDEEHTSTSYAGTASR